MIHDLARPRQRATAPVRRLRSVTLLLLLGLGVTGLGSLPPAATSAPATTAGRHTATVGLFPDRPPRKVAVDRESRPVELGVRFRASKPGRVTGAQVYKAVRSRSRTPVRASLWSASGERLATTRIRPRRGKGWITVDFRTPVRIAARTTYVVSVFAPKGHYAVTEHRLGKRRTRGDLVLPGRRNGVYRYGAKSRFPRSSFRQSNYWVDVTFRVGGGLTTTPPTVGGFPDETNTGVPDGVSLTSYTGPTSITTPGTTIDAKQVDGDLRVMAKDVTITRSAINGVVWVDQTASLSISDTDIDAGDVGVTGLEAYNYTATRVHVVGGNRSMYCADNCTIRDSYVHGQFTDETGRAHESGIRMEQRTTLIHNTITCDAPIVPPDAGCSAGLTGYGDFQPIRDNLIQNNLFLPSTGSACAYGGSSANKPYSDGAANIRFIDNVFSRGPNRTCGVYFAVTDFDDSAPGNVFEGNVWDDGGVVEPS